MSWFLAGKGGSYGTRYWGLVTYERGPQEPLGLAIQSSNHMTYLPGSLGRQVMNRSNKYNKFHISPTWAIYSNLDASESLHQAPSRFRGVRGETKVTGDEGNKKRLYSNQQAQAQLQASELARSKLIVGMVQGVAFPGFLLVATGSNPLQRGQVPDRDQILLQRAIKTNRRWEQ